MTIRKILAASIAASALLGAAAPAMAGHYRHYYRQSQVGYHTHDGPMLYQGLATGGYVDRYAWPDPWGGCIRMCNHDNLPCDPIYFKMADGRCTGDAR